MLKWNSSIAIARALTRAFFWSFTRMLKVKNCSLNEFADKDGDFIAA